jgi:phosphoglycerol transferase MdoB-like AlkP superfamily enzyme
MNGSMGFEAFANSSGFQKYFGRTGYNEDTRYHGDDDFDGTWAIWDEEFMQFYCDKMTEMREPFMTALFSASSHTPYALPERYVGKFPKGDHRIQECVAYSDNALRLFFEKASKQPWFENTIFVLTADHTSGQVDPEYLTSLGHYAVPIIIYAPGHPELHGYDTERVVEQSDIMPTVLSYIGYDKPYVAFGEDMLNVPAEDSFAIHWVPEGELYQTVYRNYAIDFDGKQVVHAYDYRADSLLTNDVRQTMPRETLKYMEELTKAVVQQYMWRMNTNNLVIK